MVDLDRCCNTNDDPIPGPRPLHTFDYVPFPWQAVVDRVEQISSKDSFHLSMLLSRQGLICGPSSGMALCGLLNFLQDVKNEGALGSLAGSDGTVNCIFMCCDLPYQYLDDYFAKLGPECFKPTINEVLLFKHKHTATTC